MQKLLFWKKNISCEITENIFPEEQIFNQLMVLNCISGHQFQASKCELNVNLRLNIHTMHVTKISHYNVFDDQRKKGLEDVMINTPISSPLTVIVLCKEKVEITNN